VVPKNTALPLATKVKYAILAAVPVALMIGAVVKVKKAGTKKGARTDDARDKGKTGAQE
jgi:hypothetical protein